MGLFSNFSAISKINTLIKQLEPKLDYIASELDYPFSANRERLRVECGTVAVLMTEILDIADNAGGSVKYAPYYLKGEKLNLMDISAIAASLVERAQHL